MTYEVLGNIIVGFLGLFSGFEVLISIRPGNAPLPSNHGFKTITSFVEI